MELRDYQIKARDAVFRELKEKNSTLLVCCTGSGKTVMFCHIGNDYRKLTQKNILVLVHREELVRQTADKIERIAGVSPEIEKAKEKANRDRLADNGWLVASIQTMIAGQGDFRRMSKFNPKDFALVIVDESHHSVSKSWKHVINYFAQEGVKVLGVTATPDRSDMESLGQLYDSVAFEYDMVDAINDGYLVPIRTQTINASVIDVSRVGTLAGDLKSDELADAMEKQASVSAICVPTLEITLGLPKGHLASGKSLSDVPIKPKKTLIFASSVYHAELICQYINQIFPDQAVFVSGKTPKEERRQILKDYKNSKFNYLVNFGVFTEGFDEPGIQCLVMARPTKSRSLYVQMLGRSARPLDGLIPAFSDSENRHRLIKDSEKPHALVLDFVYNSGKHSIVRATDALAGNVSPEIEELAKRIAIERGEQDVLKVIEEAKKKEQERHDKEKARKRAQDEALRHWKATVEYQVNAAQDMLGVTLDPPKFGARMASYDQIEKLKMFKVDRMLDIKKLTDNQARKILQGVYKRLNQGLCTIGQAMFLQSRGMSTDMTKAEASRMIGEIKNRESAGGMSLNERLARAI